MVQIINLLFLFVFASMPLLIRAYDINYVSKRITKNQFPKNPAACSQKRLLVLHMPGYAFEGTGSILKWITFGLAEAMHGNRTLIWGRYIPSFYTRGSNMECFDKSEGGLFNCLFRKISSCSLNDVSETELNNIGLNGYDDTARVSLSQARRGLAAYVPPVHLREFPNMKYIWPAALASFVFRPIVKLREFPVPDDWETPDVPVAFCAHVRHGDVLSMASEYPYRKVYPFDSYFDALKMMTEEAASHPPDLVYLATDSPSASEVVKEWQSRWQRSEEEQVFEDTCGLPAASVPTFVTLGGLRRSEFGAHIWASRGGCVLDETGLRQRCKVSGAVLTKTFDDSGDTAQESVDVLGVALESVQDLFLLSQCDRTVATGTSHFSTFAYLLAIGRVLKADSDTTKKHSELLRLQTTRIDPRLFVFLDSDEISSGALESAFLLGKYELDTNDAETWRRWASLQMRFSDHELSLSNPPLLRSGEDSLHLPVVPDYFFDDVSRGWRGESTHMHSVCNSGRPVNFVMEYGGDHLDAHPNVALYCFNVAYAIVNTMMVQTTEMVGHDGSSSGHGGANEALGAISNLIKQIRYQQFKLYKKPSMSSSIPKSF